MSGINYCEMDMKGDIHQDELIREVRGFAQLE